MILAITPELWIRIFSGDGALARPDRVAGAREKPAVIRQKGSEPAHGEHVGERPAVGQLQLREFLPREAAIGLGFAASAHPKQKQRLARAIVVFEVKPRRL